MISNRSMIYRANISFILHISDVAHVARKLSGNLGFDGIIESVPNCIECFAIHETHKDVGIVKASVIVNITINGTVGIICENFGHRHRRVLRNMNHVLGLDDVDVSAKLDNDFRRYLHDSDTMAEDQIASIQAVFLDGLGMWQAKPRSRIVNIQLGLWIRRMGNACHRSERNVLVINRR